MKNIIIAYPSMMLGGSTTSLLSILNTLDYTKFNVDLALAFHNGEWMKAVPSQVNILSPTYRYQDRISRILHRLISPKYLFYYVMSKIKVLKGESQINARQYFEMKDADFYRDILEEYDVAISFLEGQTCKYVSKHINAKKKIAWIHVDYLDSLFCSRYDYESLSKFDNIVHVSEKCLNSFVKMFPSLSSRCIVIENILSDITLNNMVKNIDKNSIMKQVTTYQSDIINIVTTCRLTYYQKGLDRTLQAFKDINRMYSNTLSKKVHWYIIGNGPDEDSISQNIVEYGLENIVSLLGLQMNPYQYYQFMDCFFLPSRYEGKPMAVTEALMLDLPVIATKYSSANEQITEGEDGMIFPNTDEGTREAILYILNNKDALFRMKAKITQKNYSNVNEILKIQSLLEK